MHCIKSSSKFAANIYGEVLCQIIRDLVPPKEILTKVIKEFLAINQPHCDVIARIVHQVNLIKAKKKLYYFYFVFIHTHKNKKIRETCFMLHLMQTGKPHYCWWFNWTGDCWNIYYIRQCVNIKINIWQKSLKLKHKKGKYNFS